VRNGVLVVALFLIGLLFTEKVIAAPAGVTVSPATVTLELQPGQTQAGTDMTVGNTYATAITLDFSVAAQPIPGSGERTLTAKQLENIVHLQAYHLELQPGQRMVQHITVQDDKVLLPGSTPIALSLTQHSVATASQIAITPKLDIPIVLLKDKGATSSFAMAQGDWPRFAWSLPRTFKATFRNTGNTIVIPRGSIAVTDTNGRTIASGVINEGSLAVVPGGRLQTANVVHQETHRMSSGRYRMAMAYKTSGQEISTVRNVSFFYIAWWQVIGFVGIAVGLVIACKKLWSTVRKRLHKKAADPPPKRIKLIGRDIT